MKLVSKTVIYLLVIYLELFRTFIPIIFIVNVSNLEIDQKNLSHYEYIRRCGRRHQPHRCHASP